MLYMRQWEFIADMDYNGAVTVSDVWLWVKWLYFLPGDFIIRIFLEENKLSNLSTFLEISVASYGGFWSGVVSFIIWFMLLNLILEVMQK